MTTDYGSSSPSFAHFRRSILSMKRDPIVHLIDNHTHDFKAQDHELEAFQKQVTQKFHDLSLVESHELLSVSWISKLLDVFLCCQKQFKVILTNHKSYLCKKPMEKLISDYFERSVKGLDVCNAIRDGIEQMRQWQKQLEIVLCVFEDKKPLAEAQFRRAKRALNSLIVNVVDKSDSSSNLSQRNRSFNQEYLQHNESKYSKHSRSSSWSVSRSSSASKQLQAIGNNIVAPKSFEIIATNGLNLAVYTMTHVLSFVMWALVAAITCEGNGLQSIFNNAPKNFAWWVPILSLQERILKECKKRDRRNCCGLLKEMHRIELYACFMNGFIDSIRFPLGEKHEEQVKKRFEELGSFFESLKNGLDPLDKQVKEVFHQIVRCRVEGLESVQDHKNEN